ncbi:class I SAM-dependent methyltransferase [Solicola sp. PLA-1-18]|uniref:class I SAM-dependent methyltransferase n=1 Tax=Solicola sp. PLA-1-18 TaxID=3380532 RepID=UPI003B781920
MDADDWDARYAEAPDLWGSSPNALLTDLVGHLAPGRAVDLGCGDGRHTAWLSGLGWEVEGVDFSPEAVRQASRRPGTDPTRARFTVADATTYAPDGPLDLVLVAYLHLPDLADVLARAVGWLAPGGRVVYLGHARENLEHGVGGPSDASVLPTVEALASGLRGARVLDLRHVDRETPRGTAVDVLAVAEPWPS